MPNHRKMAFTFDHHRICSDLDYEQFLFFLGPSSKTRETRKWHNLLLALVAIISHSLSLSLIHCMWFSSFQVAKTSLLFSLGRPATEKAQQETQSLGRDTLSLAQALQLSHDNVNMDKDPMSVLFS